MKKLLSFILSFLIATSAYAVPITGPDGTPALVNEKGQLLTKAVTIGRAREASELGNAFIFPLDFISLVAGAGEETVLFIQNNTTETRLFAIGVIAVACTDGGAMFRTYQNMTTSNAGTTLQPVLLNASLKTPFNGTFQVSDGTDTAGPVGGVVGSTGFGSLIFDTGETVLLGPGNSFAVTVDSIPGCTLFGAVAADY